MKVYPTNNILGKDTTLETCMGGKENTVPAKCNFISYLAKTSYAMQSDMLLHWTLNTPIIQN